MSDEGFISIKMHNHVRESLYGRMKHAFFFASEAQARELVNRGR